MQLAVVINRPLLCEISRIHSNIGCRLMYNTLLWWMETSRRDLSREGAGMIDMGGPGACLAGAHAQGRVTMPGWHDRALVVPPTDYGGHISTCSDSTKASPSSPTDWRNTEHRRRTRKLSHETFHFSSRVLAHSLHAVLPCCVDMKIWRYVTTPILYVGMRAAWDLYKDRYCKLYYI